MKKVAIVGTHGIGKTTLSYKLCTEAKLRGKNAIVINEVARRCPFKINDESSLDGCLWMVAEQLMEEQQAKANQCDFLVCDRSLLDMIAYVPLQFANGEIFEKLKTFCFIWLKTYDHVLWVHPSGNEIPEDGVRATDKKYQKNIHVRFQEVLDHYIGLKSIKILKSSRIFKDNIKEITDLVFEEENII